MSGSFPGDLEATLRGYFVHDAQDALAIIQLVIEGKLRIAHRRPKDQEKPRIINSGNVFVFKDMKGHIQRWTDGVTWSASRILTPFLVYRETSGKTGDFSLSKSNTSGANSRVMKSPHGQRSLKQRRSLSIESYPRMQPSTRNISELRHPTSRNESIHVQGYERASHDPSLRNVYEEEDFRASRGSDVGPRSQDVDYDLFGSLKDQTNCSENGLAKKTISVKYQGVQYRLISYFRKCDVLEGKFKRPSNEKLFRDVVIDKELWESVHEIKTHLEISEQQYSNSQRLIHPDAVHHGQYYPAPPMGFRSFQRDPRATELDPSFNAYRDYGVPFSFHHPGLGNLPSTPSAPMGFPPRQHSTQSILSQHWFDSSNGAESSTYYPSGRGGSESYGSGSMYSPYQESIQARGAQSLGMNLEPYNPQLYGVSGSPSNTAGSTNGFEVQNTSIKREANSREDNKLSLESTKGHFFDSKLHDDQMLSSGAISVNKADDFDRHIEQCRSLLPSISPGSSPLGPSNEAGISANTFMVQEFPHELLNAASLHQESHVHTPVSVHRADYDEQYNSHSPNAISAGAGNQTTTGIYVPGSH